VSRARRQALPHQGASSLSTQRRPKIAGARTTVEAHPAGLSPPRLMRPLRDLLTTWDVRVRRFISPFWRPPVLLSPLGGTPPRRPDRVHRGVQYLPTTISQAVQSESDWESRSEDERPQHKVADCYTQVDAPVTTDRRSTTRRNDRTRRPPYTVGDPGASRPRYRGSSGGRERDLRDQRPFLGPSLF